VSQALRRFGVQIFRLSAGCLLPSLRPFHSIGIDQSGQAVASQNKVSFASGALMARCESTPSGDAANPFGMDDDVLGLLTMATDSAKHSITAIDDLMMMTIRARDAAQAYVADRLVPEDQRLVEDHRVDGSQDHAAGRGRKRLDSENRALSERVAKLEALSNVRAFAPFGIGLMVCANSRRKRH
jgi:hypothetical protein